MKNQTVIILATMIELIKDAIGSIPKIIPISVEVKLHSFAKIGKKGATTFMILFINLIYLFVVLFQSFFKLY